MKLDEQLSSTAHAVLLGFMEACAFADGELIMEQGEPGNGLYLLESGTVRVEVDVSELDTDVVVGFLEDGALLGELSLFDGAPRSASAYAHTPVVASWLSKEAFETLCDAHPKVALQLYATINMSMGSKIRQLNKRLVGHLFTEVQEPSVDTTVAAAVAAQAQFADWSEAAVDAVLADIAEALVARADELAEATVVETGLGIVADKAFKIRLASQGIYKDLSGKVGHGWIPGNTGASVQEMAIPMGVVLGLIPVSNPVPTIGFKALICLKSRNALIMSCHRGAAQVAACAGGIIRDVLSRHGAPPNLIQWVQGRTGRRMTSMYMTHPDISFILATGGASMVRAAYSSGTPCIGVGAGNAPVLIAADADLNQAARAVILGKSFDCGMLCSSENNLVVERSVCGAFIDALERSGAAVVQPNEALQTRETLFDPIRGNLCRKILGQPPERIAKLIGLKRDKPIDLIVVPASREELGGPLGREKMAPVLSLFTAETFEDALALSCQLLNQEGAGHTAVIHSSNTDNIQRFATSVPASRVIANTAAGIGVAGVGTGLVPSFTLGCGTMGGSSTSDNVTYTHVRNIKRLAYPE